MKPGDPVRHVDGWTGTVRATESHKGLTRAGLLPLEYLVHRDDTQRSEWVRVEDLSDAV